MLIFLTMQMKVRQPMSPIGVHRLGLLHTEGLRQSVVELTARKSMQHRLSPLAGDPGSVCNMSVVVVCTLSPFVVYRCSPRCSDLSPREPVCVAQQKRARLFV